MFSLVMLSLCSNGTVTKTLRTQQQQNSIHTVSKAHHPRNNNKIPNTTNSAWPGEEDFRDDRTGRARLFPCPAAMEGGREPWLPFLNIHSLPVVKAIGQEAGALGFLLDLLLQGSPSGDSVTSTD